MEVQQLELSAFTAVALGSIPGRGTKIQQDMRYCQKKNQKNSKQITGFKSRYFCCQGSSLITETLYLEFKLLENPLCSATPWIAAYQAPPSMGFSRQKYWSGVPLPSLLPNSLEEHFASFFLLQESYCFLFSLKYFVWDVLQCFRTNLSSMSLVSHINLILLSSCPSGVHRPNLGQRLYNAFPQEHT